MTEKTSINENTKITAIGITAHLINRLNLMQPAKSEVLKYY